MTRAGSWLIDVRPGERIKAEDRVRFAAASEAALSCGWRYGAHIPAGQWPAQMTRQQKKDQAREVMQSDAAAAGRPARTAGQSGDPAEEQGPGSVVALRWPDRARQAETAVDDERRHRREQAVPQRPAAPGGLGDRLRRTSLLLIPGEEPRTGSRAPGRSGEAR